MKNILVLLFFVSNINCYGHSNLIDNSKDKLWYIVKTVGFYPPFDFKYSTSVLKFDEIFVKNDTSYANVTETADSSFLNWKTIGQIQESNQKVFFKPILSDSLYLIYDFNLETNYTFNISDLTHTLTFHAKIETVDTINIGGEYRKRYIFANLNEVWIEGIGSLQGLLHKGLGFSGVKYELGCYTENGNIIYHNPTYPTCFYTTDIKTSSDYSKTLFVAKGKFSILQKKGAKFQLFDIHGVKILDRSIDSDFYSINTYMLQSGVFLFRIADSDLTIIGKLYIDNKD